MNVDCRGQRQINCIADLNIGPAYYIVVQPIHFDITLPKLESHIAHRCPPTETMLGIKVEVIYREIVNIGPGRDIFGT